MDCVISSGHIITAAAIPSEALHEVEFKELILSALFKKSIMVEFVFPNTFLRQSCLTLLTFLCYLIQALF
ncbi:hypothetical protein WH47_11109 [Habropoda laboriosa]|uniref:Uncharacterized protein n=1 Tax=Habropoda laboriosa TaxID=597456 RepID=A0A0L7RA22_9HYME|nr:hypothetical protein WH47_11109 [Habropoda laboriosa]